MRLIDTHAHLDEDGFRHDLDDVLQRATEAGLQKILSQGTTAESSQATVQLAQQHPLIVAAVGIHPNYASQAKPDDWEIIERLVTEDQVVAVGETGLDRYWDYSPFDLQIEYFQKHIELAKQHELPFIVHCRDAEEETVRELTTAANGKSLTGVMHSFCGSRETLEATLALGMHISFAGMFTFKRNDELRSLAKLVPTDRLLVETDAPYLAPEPKRGKRNEPAYVEHTARKLAEVLDMTPDELGNLTTRNAQSLFAIED